MSRMQTPFACCDGENKNGRDDERSGSSAYTVEPELMVAVCHKVTFVEQGHIRVGPTTVTDPAFLVTR